MLDGNVSLVEFHEDEEVEITTTFGEFNIVCRFYVHVPFSSPFLLFSMPILVGETRDVYKMAT